MNALLNFIKDEDGLAAIEYVIAAGLLVVGLVLVFSTLGEELQAKLKLIIGAIKTPVQP